MNNSITTIIQHLYDSVNGLRECADQLDAERLKTTLLEIAGEREQWIRDLKYQINSNLCHGTAAGPLHRMFIDLKGLLTHGNIDSINTEIKRGDSTLIDTYRDVLQMPQLTMDERALLMEQLETIEQNQFEIDEVAFNSH